MTEETIVRDTDPAGRYFGVSSETCSVCGMYSDEAFHGICQESVTA